MRKTLLAICLILGLAGVLHTQQTNSLTANPLGGNISASTTNCTVAQSCVWMKLPPNAGAISFTLQNGVTTFSGTIILEASGDGGNTFTTLATYVSTTVTAAQFSISGMTDVRARCSTYLSGIAVVNIQASLAMGPSSATITGSLPAGANAIGTVGITNTAGSTDPCQNPSVIKSSTFANITTATTTAIVTSSGSTKVYVCGFAFDMVATTAADTLLLEDGTGAACATTQVPKTATFSSGILTNGSEQLAVGLGGQTVFSTAASGEVCAVSTVGTGPTIALQVSYVQQ